ncbi:hypothetical protein XELAEV_18002802mg [Xenopus laevis]|nr:hypothetical protein XELAEV_18002802mg [Xenopus laevis]
MLDQFNFCLDHLEDNNDQLHAQLQDLLESKRQARRDFQMQIHQQTVQTGSILIRDPESLAGRLVCDLCWGTLIPPQ